METHVESGTRSRATQFFLFITISVLRSRTWPCSEAATTTTTQEFVNGFKATPDHSVSSFQSLLTDSTANFSLGFLRINRTQLTLAVLHVTSSEPLWVANPTGRLARWSYQTQLSFNGSLVIADPRSKVFWSTETQGDRVVLLNDSNLQIQKLDNSRTVVWQSFQFPTNTLVENQNFTSTMTLVSSNGLYSMRLGDNFMGLYAKFKENKDQIYLKHKALQVKATIVEGAGPIYARVNSDGFLGMYQRGDAPVDVQPFNSFQRVMGGLLIVRLEPDGNLKGYYWDGSNWVFNYQAILDSCELPSPCGPYSLCLPGSGCSCLDNRTDFRSGGCVAPSSGDFCGGQVLENEFRVLRRKGVELPFKELMGYQTTSSMEQCEGLCEKNCSCWGAVYNNASGFCYFVDYPIQTLVGVGDETKVGYFKVRKGTGKKKMASSVEIGIGLLSGVILFLIGFTIGRVSYKILKRRKGVERILVEEGGVSPGPYKDLGSASFRSIEMCNR